jgi:acetoacetyl-[acyl-carrier protein] synthase
MINLPVIVGFGGISPAGRSAFHYGYKRIIYSSLPRREQIDVLQNLAVLTSKINYSKSNDLWFNNDNQEISLHAFLENAEDSLLGSTLIRKLEDNLFNPRQLLQHQPLQITGTDSEPLAISIPTRRLPLQIPPNWTVLGQQAGMTQIQIEGGLDCLVRDYYSSPVNSAGQLPSGFQPDMLYAARSHPRALQMTIYGCTDALLSLGISWETLREHVPADQIGVFAGSAMNQLDYHGYGGLLQARLLGKKVTSKQLPLGFGDMPADFINAYMIGNVGSTGSNLGACAAFLYNLRMAVKEIQSGRLRVALVGAVEAPLTPEIIEAFSNMNALADDASLLALDAELGITVPNYRRACRPFGQNVGFTLAESGQFVVLFDDSLAVELGAQIFGSVNDVFVNADGNKKSIASPGVGNYLTMARACGAIRSVLGDKSLRERSLVQAHGTGTPQNRVTESAIFSTMAKNWGINKWPVTALKSYLGHSIACAGADQLVMSLGIWAHGIIPGIQSTHELAEDVSKDGLDFLLSHREINPSELDSILINSKGFGGNNATASLFSPHITNRMLNKRHGMAAMKRWQTQNEAVRDKQETFKQQTQHMHIEPLYYFDHEVKDGSDLELTPEQLRVIGYAPIQLSTENPYEDMC